MLRALATLSVLAVVSFAFSSAVAFVIATHAAPVDAAPADLLPAVDDRPGMTCPALPHGTTPQCPGLRGDRPSMADIAEAARRAGCPAFSGPARPLSPTLSVPPPDPVVVASYGGALPLTAASS